MTRREFIALVGGVTVAATLPPHAQQGEHLRRVGMLVGFDDPDIKIFQQELEKLGWSEGRNVHIDYLYAPAGAQVQALAKDLITLQPDVIFSQSRPATAALQHATNTIPIVFCYVIDPIGAGFVNSFPRPGGNLTGFVVYEPSVVGKWMEMLKEIAPQTTRAALLGNPKTAVYYDYLLHARPAAAGNGVVCSCGRSRRLDGAALARLQNAADSLVRTPWAKSRIEAISADRIFVQIVEFSAATGAEHVSRKSTNNTKKRPT